MPGHPAPARDPAPRHALPTEETLRFLERALPAPPARLLEVGCGDGAVAAALAARGYDVTALDEALAPDGAAARAPVRWIEADFHFHDEPGESYDVVLFTRSLHHMGSLDRALDRAASLLRAEGRLVAEEFAFDRVTLPTARWWYDAEALLVAAGVLDPPDATLAAIRNPLGRWRQEHAHEPPLATGHDMLAAVRERFHAGPAEEAPYLYRYAHARSRPGEAAVRAVRELFEIESRLLRERDLAAAGLRIVATRPA